MPKISSFTIAIAAGTSEAAAVLKAAAFAIALAMLGAATSARAAGVGEPCTSAPEDGWLSIEALEGKVEALGYKVQKADLKSACGDMYVIDKKNGARLQLFVDPTSGDIIRRLWLLP